MSLIEIDKVECYTWQLLSGVRKGVNRRELSNSTALKALSRFCVTDKNRLQIEAELEAHLLPLIKQQEEAPPPKSRTQPSVFPRTRPQWTKVKRLNRICAETCIRTANLISLSLRAIVKLYQTLIEHPNLSPSAKYLEDILSYVSCAIRIWAETVDREEYRGVRRPELRRNDRRLARAAHMQYCGQILLTVCRMTWPEDQHEWIEEEQIIFDKEAEDFAEAFIFDGSLTYRHILEGRKTVLDSGQPRKQFIILQKLDRLRHDGLVTKQHWYQPDPALPFLQDFCRVHEERDAGQTLRCLVYGIVDQHNRSKQTKPPTRKCPSVHGTCGDSGLPVSTGGQCGSNGHICAGFGFGDCCSQWGYCGSTDDYCGAGCQSKFGSCNARPDITTDGTCSSNSDPEGASCAGSGFGDCYSEWGYCRSTNAYCGTGCQSALVLVPVFGFWTGVVAAQRRCFARGHRAPPSLNYNFRRHHGHTSLIPQQVCRLFQCINPDRPRPSTMGFQWRFPSEPAGANSTSRALQDPELQQQLEQLKQIREKEQRLLQERRESLNTWFGPRSFRQLGLFFAGAGFLACTVGITRRAVLRKQVTAAPKFFSPSKYIKPEPRVDAQGNKTKVIDPEAEGGPLAVQALGLATLNVFSFAIMMTGGLSWAFDISSIDDLRVLARRKIHAGEGDPDPGGEKEIEDWMSNMMLRSKDSSDQDTAADGTAITEPAP
ncbi:uncharacterized protein PpBr36_09680 [Pyricularia pennisetigena]|uniref:uncharacterized protein n=1 Tax=Pyricularia pennisetigena TaxID=1578925 RepID=UPI001151571E|nr:uncharacterized protein PpBr36_09680 [Pyricularia pennisetigena]TLS22564.1 hypothetical protein PpBr36_09680 [Pyricularia pennisetigena]